MANVCDYCDKLPVDWCEERRCRHARFLMEQDLWKKQQDRRPLHDVLERGTGHDVLVVMR